jgi:oxygen-independent coproporphyrinogen-3 oxidase
MTIGLYIHVPFCVKKCNYCSFYSVPLKEELVSRYLAALAREMEMRARLLFPEERPVDSIFIGGGTPTCLSGEDLAGILENVSSFFNVAGGAEITVEANPGTLQENKLRDLKNAGVNRLSIGFQACCRGLLETLGRIHSYSGAAEFFRKARRAGFDNINVDLIYGIPGQSLEQWKSCLVRVAGLGPDHISAYGLQLEDGTPLWRRVREGDPEPCPEDLEADMYLVLIDTLTAFGYIHYEVSNFALPGKICRHNLRYWRNLPYLGLGPAAHSYLDGRRSACEPSLDGYLEKLEAGRLPVCRVENGGPEEEMSETIFLGLRLMDGLDLEGFRKRFGKSIEDVYPEEVRRLSGLGLIKREEGRLRLTRRGLMLGNRVFSEFV